MIWTAFLLVQAVLLYFILAKRTCFRSRCKSDPPLDKGLIPWLGHALEFGKDAAKFLNRMRMKHGDIFTVRVAGHYVTVLLDPHSYDSVIKDVGSLDFTRYANVLMDRVFSLQLPQHHNQAKEKALMRQHFQGANASRLYGTMQRHLDELLNATTPQNQTDWKTDGLFNFCYSLLFRAGYLTLFGGEQNNNRGADPSEVYREYRKFDALLTKLARRTLKADEKRRAHSVRTRLCELLASAGLTGGTWGSSSAGLTSGTWGSSSAGLTGGTWGSSSAGLTGGTWGSSSAGLTGGTWGSSSSPWGSSSSPWLHDYRQLLKEEGADEEMQRKAALLQLWATLGNVGPAAFWLLGYLLTNPDALTAVRSEFSRCSRKKDTSQQSASLDGDAHTPVFDSALEEALRLTAAPFITREVVQDKTLHMADGREYLLRKGDRVVLFPFLSPQTDPEIYHEPQKYKYDRFLNEDGSPKKDFYKRGRSLKYYTMPWGAGANGCVGKQFAINTIRQFVFMVCSRYDVELCEGSRAQMPDVNTSRYGFGMLQPEGDLSIRYRPK